MHGFCLGEVRGSPPCWKHPAQTPLEQSPPACGCLGFLSPPFPSLLHRDRPAGLALGLRSFHRRHCISRATESKPAVSGGPGGAEDHPPDRASHLSAAGVASHPRVERVMPSFVFAAGAVDEPEWHDALALQEAVFVPPL